MACHGYLRRDVGKPRFQSNISYSAGLLNKFVFFLCGGWQGKGRAFGESLLEIGAPYRRQLACPLAWPKRVLQKVVLGKI